MAYVNSLIKRACTAIKSIKSRSEGSHERADLGSPEHM